MAAGSSHGAAATAGLLRSDPYTSLSHPEATPRDLLKSLSTIAMDHVTPIDTEALGGLLGHPDDRVRTVAAAVAIRIPGFGDHLGRLIHFFDTEDVRAVRSVVEAAPRPLPDSARALVAALEGRDEPGFGWLACDLMARCDRSLAEALLVEAGSRAPHLPATRRLDALARVGREPSADVLAGGFVSRLAPERDAAARALRAIVSRRLGSGDQEGAQRILETLRHRAPRDIDLAKRLARVVGLYRSQAEPALALLDRVAARHPVGLTPQEAVDGAEILVARAMVLACDADLDAARSTLAEAIARLGEPTNHARDAAILLARALLLDALVAIQQGQPRVADGLLKRAIAAAPYDPYYGCQFDLALEGVFGPLTVIDLLRRRGSTATGILFHDRLQHALVRADGMLAVFESSDDFPEPGSDRAVVDNERVKSWAPLHRLRFELHAGHTADVRRIGQALVAHLEATEVFANRNLAAQARILIGRACLLDGDADKAERAFRSAVDELRKLGRSWLEYDLEDRRGRFAPGTPPFRAPLADQVARAWLGVADTRRILRGDPTGAGEAARSALAADPTHDGALLAVAALLAGGEDRDRARRVLESMPRTVDRLLGLARLARALDRDELADELFERHVAWNCLTEESERAERGLLARDPAL